MKYEYIFLAGAPGSRWSSVAKYLYSSPQLDTSDNKQSYTMPGADSPMHLGAYWDPGMAYGQMFDIMNKMAPKIIEDEFNHPFTGDGIRLIKSHQFCKHLDYLADNWKSPIIMAYREDQVSYDWWMEAGGFDITYPNYVWYKNRMMKEIQVQNAGVLDFVEKHNLSMMRDTNDLERALQIDIPTYFNFYEADTNLYVYNPIH